MDQLKADLVPAMKLGFKETLAEWDTSRKPAPPVSLKQGKEEGGEDAPIQFPKILDVKIDGRPAKAELLDPKTGVYAAQVEMSAGIAGLVEQGDRFRILNVSLPIVSAGVGVATGMVVGNIIDVVVPPADMRSNPTKAVLNIGAQSLGVWAVMRYGSGFMGPTAARIGAAIIIFRVLARLLPVQQWIDSITGTVTGFLPTIPGMSQLNAGQGEFAQPTSKRAAVYRGTI